MEKEARTPVKTPALPREEALQVYSKTPIIVEGVDCSGKTTFCRWIVEELISRKANVEFYHHGPLRATVDEEYVDPLRELTIYENTIIVADRWHLGEMVYGPLYRGKSEMSKEKLDEIESLLDYNNAVKVLLDPPAYEIRRRMQQRGEDFLKPEDVTKARDMYCELAATYGYNVLHNPTYGDAVFFAKKVLR